MVQSLLKPFSLCVCVCEQVEVNEQAMRQLFILNSGKFNFDYSWHLNDSAATRRGVVHIERAQGGVMCGETQQCTLFFCPPIRMSLRGCELSLKVTIRAYFVLLSTHSHVTQRL